MDLLDFSVPITFSHRQLLLTNPWRTPQSLLQERAVLKPQSENLRDLLSYMCHRNTSFSTCLRHFPVPRTPFSILFFFFFSRALLLPSMLVGANSSPRFASQCGVATNRKAGSDGRGGDRKMAGWICDQNPVLGRGGTLRNRGCSCGSGPRFS